MPHLRSKIWQLTGEVQNNQPDQVDSVADFRVNPFQARELERNLEGYVDVVEGAVAVAKALLV